MVERPPVAVRDGSGLCLLSRPRVLFRDRVGVLRQAGGIGLLAIGTTLVDELVGDDARAVDDGCGLGFSVTVGPRVGTVGEFSPCGHGRAFGERVRLLLDGLRVPFGCSAVEVHVHGGGAAVLPLVRLRVEFAVGVHDAEDDAGDVLALGEVLRLLSEVAFDDVGGLDDGHGVLLWLVGIAP